eukprot:4566844-Amphidinium_carterae.1
MSGDMLLDSIKHVPQAPGEPLDNYISLQWPPRTSPVQSHLRKHPVDRKCLRLGAAPQQAHPSGTASAAEHGQLSLLGVFLPFRAVTNIDSE